MIRVNRAPEPEGFYDQVQIPGERFIRNFPNPTTKQWRTHNYWRIFAKELHGAYGGVCAYYCQYIPFVTGSDTVDHFRPKKKYPDEAYKWDNYRLVSGMMNGRKKDFEDVIDPFLIDGDWFVIDFDTLFVRENTIFPTEIQQKVRKTIKRLKLNDTDCINGRIDALKIFAKSESFSFLEFWTPFIARELLRQDMVATILSRFQEMLNAGILE